MLPRAQKRRTCGGARKFRVPAAAQPQPRAILRLLQREVQRPHQYRVRPRRVRAAAVRRVRAEARVRAETPRAVLAARRGLGRAGRLPARLHRAHRTHRRLRLARPAGGHTKRRAIRESRLS